LDEAILTTLKDVDNKLKEDIGAAMEKAYKSDQNSIIYIDRNHTPNPLK